MMHVPRFLPALPLTPAGYLRLVRKSCDATIEQVASLIAVRADDQAEVRRLIRQLEIDGVTAREPTTIALLARVLPIDPGVYFQLATEPADRHPGICRNCGASAASPRNWVRSDCCPRCSDPDGPDDPAPASSPGFGIDPDDRGDGTPANDDLQPRELAA